MSYELFDSALTSMQCCSSGLMIQLGFDGLNTFIAHISILSNAHGAWPMFWPVTSQKVSHPEMSLVMLMALGRSSGLFSGVTSWDETGHVSAAMGWVKIKIKLNDNFYIAHISIPRMLTALGVYIQMYRGRPCQRFEPGSPAYQSAALTTRPNPRPNS
jgi:hypothetical protein